MVAIWLLILSLTSFTYLRSYTKNNLVLGVIGWWHMIWGVTVLLEIAFGEPISSIAISRSLRDFMGKSVEADFFRGVIITLAGLSALVALSAEQKLKSYPALRAVLFGPQQVLLMFSSYDVLWCMLQGHYADGYTPESKFFIIKDQFYVILLLFAHTLALSQLTVREELR